MIKTAITSILTTAILGIVAFYYMPLFSVDKIHNEHFLGATVTEISGGDTMSSFPTIYNANLNALNSAKIEISTTTLPNITTLASLSTVGTIGTGVWQGTGVGVAYGGTGASTLGSNLVLLGNGTGAIQSVAAGDNDQILTLVGGVPTWDSGSIDETLAYDWTGKHSWSASSTFTGRVDLDGFVVADSLLIASSTITEYPTASTSIASRGFVENYVEDTNYYFSASDNLKASADTERNTTASSYAKLKEIIIGVGGTIRVKFDLKAENANAVNGRIYVNGVAVGTEQSETSTSYVTYSEDIVVYPTDLIQLYAHRNASDGSSVAYVSNFRFYFDLNKIMYSDVITD